MEDIHAPEEPHRQTLTLPVAIFIAGLVIAGAIIYTRDRPNAVAEEKEVATSAKNYGPENIDPITEKDHILGNPNAPVKIVEYSDTECPFCKDFHPIMHEAVDTFGRDGKIAWVYRHFPLVSKHPKAVVEAHAAECAGEVGGEVAYWAYLDKIFEITPANNGFDLVLLPKIAQDLKLDLTAWTTCQDSNKYRALIDTQLQDGIESGVTGTPTSFVITKSGKVYPIEGWVSFDALRQIIELAIADKL